MTLPDPYIWIPFESDTLDDTNDDGIELMVDSDMSAPTAVAYTSGNSANLSKVSNGEGGQALRVERGGVDSPYATQAVTINGVHYNARTRARGDSVVNGDARTEGGTTNFFCTPSAAWQQEAWEQRGGTILTRLGSTATGVGQYTDYDSYSIKRMQKRWLDKSGNNIHCLRGDGYTADSLPVTLPGKGIEVGAVQQYAKIPDSLRSTPAFTTSIMLRFPAVNALQEICDAYDGGSPFFLFLVNASNVLQFYSGGVAAANGATYVLPSNITHRDWIHIAGTYDGANTKLYVNGCHVASAATPLAPVFANQNIWFGRFYNGTRNLLGKYMDYRYFDQGYLTDEQHNELFQTVRYRVARLAA